MAAGQSSSLWAIATGGYFDPSLDLSLIDVPLTLDVTVLTGLKRLSVCG